LTRRSDLSNMSYMTNKGLTRKQNELLKQMHQDMPLTIYQLAKAVGRPYRRVHDHVKQFAAMGLVTLKQATINNRKATLVISNNIYYQRLLHLDDMYAAHRELMP
jgi:predicted transcriptional regulator